MHTSKFEKLITVSALAIFSLAIPQQSSAGVAITITIAPPALPVYTQPPCPTPGYLWSPGYWAWSPVGYYWVPGVWVQPPRVGVLWTPGYWAFGGRDYLWHAGYWGPHVGFYGGVNYGFGFGGVGFFGGSWSGNVFRYNTAVTNVNTMIIRNVYVDRTVIRNTVINNTTINNRASFNGPGGINARPSPQEQVALREPHVPPTSMQFSHQQTAGQDRNQLASVNNGRPSTAAMDSVNGRRFNQQDRVAAGVASWHLTAGETGNLERREAGLSHEIRSDRRANDGTLTAQERRQVNSLQNNLSQSIYTDKHNGVDADRRANNGQLAPGKRRNINREQNRETRQIQRENHNERIAPK